MLKFSVLRDLKVNQLNLNKLSSNNNSICHNSFLFKPFSHHLKINQSSHAQILPFKTFKRRPQLNIGIYHFASNINNANKFSTNEGKYKETKTTYSWVNTYLPSKLVPYAHLARLDKPIGTWLLYLPCTWSITMATHHAHLPASQTMYMLTLFGIGAFIMRGAGCTINDMWDKEIDSKVERTANRPLAFGVITPFQALAFLGLQLSAGLAVLIQLNWYSIFLGATSLSLVTVYPFMKRVTFWPQLYLGLAFNWGALLGWPAMTGISEWTVTFPLYAAGVCWTLIYDTIYAHQDKKFDSVVGVKSTALLFGNKTRHWLTFFSGSMLSYLTLAGYMNGNDWPYYFISVMGVGSHLAWQLWTVNFDDVVDCGRKFRSSKWTGAIVLSGIVIDIMWQNLNSVN